MKNWKWKKDYGDGQETDDSVLWINGKPTNNYISGYGYYTAYIDGVEFGYIFDTLKEAKQEVEEQLDLHEFDFKVGDKVNAIFHKYGSHKVIGVVTEVSKNEHGLDDTWVSIKVTDGDRKDKSIDLMFQYGNLNIMCPIRDVKPCI